MSGHTFHPSLLRDYDVRGVVDATLTASDATALGRSFGTVIRRGGGSHVAVGRDGRLSSPALAEALIAGLRDSGCAVTDIGQGPTPLLYFAVQHLESDGGVMVTGSHNPPDHNGFKLVAFGDPFHGKSLAALGPLAQAGDWDSGTGTVTRADLLDAYVDRLLEGFRGDARRVAWDAGNGAAGPVVEALVRRLPGRHFTLFTEVDGHFPHHHPDPSVEANLADLRRLVAERNCDFGVAFDGDGDRIGVIDGAGRVLWGDQLLQIYAAALLRERPGATIVGDVKMSATLFDRIAELGGKPLMAKSGHSPMKAMMKRVSAPLAGEMSGHIFFAHRFYGADDALYAAVQLIEAETILGRSVTQMRDAMRVLPSTPELRFPVAEARKFAVVAEVLARLEAAGAQVDRTDGARVTTPDGWWLLRASNTEALLTARAEAADAAGLDRLVAEIDAQLALSGVARVI